MAGGDSIRRTSTWLLEHYEPGASPSLLRRRVSAMATVARRSGVRMVVAVVLPGDEEVVCLLQATSAGAIRAACRRTELRVDRLTRVEPVHAPDMEVGPCAPES